LSKTAFIRETTGLVREWSWFDTFTYNVYSCGGFISWQMLYILAASPVIFPGGDALYALFIGALICIPHIVAYGLLAVAMPRSGGDYVFQSRILHPALAFMVNMAAWVIWLFNWVVWAALGGISVTIYPLLSLLGVTTGNSAFLDAAAWTITTDGTAIIAVIIIISGFLLCMAGMRFIARSNIVVFIGVLVGWLILMALCIPNSPSTFGPAFDEYMAAIGSNATYQSVIAEAQSTGFNVSPSFSLTKTIGIVPMAYGAVMWFFWSVYNSGEVKRASEFRTYLKGMLGAMAWVIFMLVTITYFYIRLIGSDFWNAISYAYVQGTPSAAILPTLPSYTLLPMLLVKNPIVIAIFYIAIALQYPIAIALNFLPASRIMLAMSFDRLLPEKVAAVDNRLHNPYVTYIIGLVGGLIWFYLLYYTEAGTWIFSMLSVSTIAIIITCLAAVVLPYRRVTRSIYEAYPFARTRILGVPAVTMVGLVGLLLNGWMLYYFVIDPTYGAWIWPTGVLVNVGVFIFCLVWYYATKIYRKSQGIDVSLAFREVPPE